eukprot:SM000010S04353  [mRNA]  locus=s10:1125664:1133388:+ [translate_table: standard]
MVSQAEYVARLRELNDEIAHAWLRSERVAALRLAIKVAKLLGDTSVPPFYPALFVLVTDVLDTLGSLVWARIKQRAEQRDDAIGAPVTHLPANFTHEDIRQEAKDTCANWFFKIGSIRELLPRVYLEMALLQCMHFLEPGPPVHAFQRLTLMLRGIADPLASAYARLYLARRGRALITPAAKESTNAGSWHGLLAAMGGLQLSIPSSFCFPAQRHVVAALEDFCVLLQRVLRGDGRMKFKSGVSQVLYLQLLEPAIEWLFHCLLNNASEELMDSVLGLLGVSSRISSSTADSWQGLDAPKCTSFGLITYQLINHLPATFISVRAVDFIHLAEGVADVYVPQPREAVLNEFLEKLWGRVRQLQKVEDNCQPFIESMCFKLITHCSGLNDVLALASFTDLLGSLSGDWRVSANKHLLTIVARGGRLRDPASILFAVEVGRSLHNLTGQIEGKDERRQVAQLLCSLIHQVDHGNDLDSHLDFLVDCRASFYQFDSVLEQLVQAANTLAMTELILVKGAHNDQLRDFAKACIAFSHITIPSIHLLLPRLHLYLQSAEVAHANGLQSHTTALLAFVLASLQEASEDSGMEMGYSSFLKKLMSFIVLVRDTPDLEPHHFPKSLLVAIQAFPWAPGGLGSISVLCSCLAMVAAKYRAAERKDAEYLAGLEELATLTVEQLLAGLQAAPPAPLRARKALETCHALLAALEAEDEVQEACSALLRAAAKLLPRTDSYFAYIEATCRKYFANSADVRAP